jgi:competence protein ComEA
MLKKILAIAVMLYAAVCFAAVDANKATAAELDGIKGIGPSISSKILDERKKGNFKDWTDFISRVKGLGEANAAKFSAEGLTVNGTAFKAAAAAPAAAPAAPTAKTAAPAPVASAAKAAAPAAAASAAKPAASAPKK